SGVEESTSSVAALDERIAALGSAVEGSADSVAALEASMAEASRETAERETEVRALSNRFQDSSARGDALVAELQQALASMPAPVTADAVEDELTAVQSRLQALEQTRGTAALEIARVSTAWSEERSQIQERVEQLAASLDRVEALPTSAESVDEERI